MDDPVVWAGIYVAAAAAFGLGEISMAGTFFLLPFAIGALVAAVVSLLGAPLLVSFPIFLAASFGVFLGFRPLARRLDADLPDVAGIGANRLVGATGTVMEAIPATGGEAGMVRVEAEEWKAATHTGIGLPAGAMVRVIEVRGTRLVVEPVDA